MLPNIQLLRAVAVYMVVFVHLRQLLPDSHIALVLHDKGYSGVDLFFVISGFIMVYATSRNRISAAEFLLHRARRIAPLYYLATILVFVIAVNFPFVLQNTSPNFYALLKSLAFIPFEKSPGRIYPLYYLGWTLNYEIFFYLIFALSLSIWYEMRVALCTAMISGLVLFGLFSSSDPDNVMLYFYSRPIMLDFCLGMIIALLRDQISAVMHRFFILPWLSLSLGLTLLASSSVWPIAPSLYAPPTNTFLTFGVPAALIVVAAVGLDDVKTRGQPWRFFQEVGNASYSIYLTHFFVVAALTLFANRIHLSSNLRTLLALLTIPLIAFVGIAVYRFLERPIMSMLARRKKAELRPKIPPPIPESVQPECRSN